MSLEIVTQVRAHIAEGRLEEAVDLLQASTPGLPDAAQEDMLLLAGRLRELQQREVRGTISHEDGLLEQNQIREQLLRVIQTYGQPPAEMAKRRRQRLPWIIALGIYLLLAVLAVSWLVQPQSSFPVAADLLVERVSFTYLGGPANFTRGQIRNCAWQNYQRIQVEGQTVRIDADGDQQWEAQSALNADLLFRPDESVPGLAARFGPAQLERLYLEPGALLTLTRSPDQADLVQLTIQQETELNSDWTYQDSLDIDLEMATLEGLPALEVVYSPARFRVFPPAGQAREVKLSAFPGTSQVDLHFAEGFNLEGKDLLIAEPSFYQPLESVAVPAVLAGEIRIGKPYQAPWTVIAAAEGEALDLYTDQPLSLQKIAFAPDGIRLAFTGTVQRIETGRDHIARNPSRWQWHWHSNKPAVLGLGLVFLGAGTALLLLAKRKW